MTVRVLQVVGQMHRGGVETWLMQVLRTIDRARVRMDFLVNRVEPGHYDAEIRGLGSRTIPVSHPRNPFAFARDFARVLRESGPYDVVHSHVHHSSGLVLTLARLHGVPVRIAHSHLDTTAADERATLARQGYVQAMRAGMNAFATSGLAASEVAASALFGRKWRSDRRWKILRCALDFSAYRGTFDRAEVRRRLGVPPHALLIGHVGRFDPQKNHAFLVDIASRVVQMNDRAHFVLVGDGPLRGETESRVSSLGLSENVHFLGIRSDVPDVLRALDAFLLPSLHEGLPLVGLESQAAGTPVVLSNSITRELEVIPELFTWCGLSDPAETWAKAVLAAAAFRHVSSDVALARMESSDFHIHRSLRHLEAEYACA